MATTQSDILNIQKAPLLYKLLPFVISGSYFSYAYWYKKDSLASAGAISAMLFAGSALPWLSYKQNVPPLTASALAGTDAKANLDIAGHLNAMDSAGRKLAIDYIVARLEEMDATRKYAAPGPPSKEKRQAALQTLTNEELKVLYLIHKFNDDKLALTKKYGSNTGDALIKKAAKEVYGIDLSALSNIEKIASVALAKAMAALK